MYMKKWIFGLSLVLLILLGLVYLLIPSRLPVSGVKFIHCTPSATSRFLTDTSGWRKWWNHPDADETKNTDAGGPFIEGGDTFALLQKSRETAEISIQNEGQPLSSMATILALPGDSCVVHWETTLEAGQSPLGRIRQYRRALRIRDQMSALLGRLQHYLDKPQNVYGQELQESSTVDTLLIATIKDLPSYPSTADIYQLVALLRSYAQSQGADVTGFPLLNTQHSDSSYRIMVALPLNKQLDGRPPIFFTRMIPGKFIVSEVHGGAGRVEEALTQIQHFFDDYKRTSMAIRFQALVTDRKQEPDSSKWVTKIYAPVF
jgi:hypothetical protein